MGSTIQQICNHNSMQELENSNKNTKIIQGPPSIIAAQVVKLRCAICSQEITNTELNQHLDLCHFASVLQKNPIEQKTNCLLCNFKSESLEQHKNHLRYRHSYMDNVSKRNFEAQKRGTQRETNEHIKKRVKILNKNQFTTNSDGSIQIEGQKYNAHSFSKQYNAMEFYQDNAMGDIVWKEIFDSLSDATHFYIEYAPQQKNIKAISKIFTKAAPYSPTRRANP